MQIGLVLYSDSASVEFYLEDYDSLEDVIDHIRGIVHILGNTNTADGLETMHDDVFRTDRGDRSGVPNVAVLLTDGQANIRSGDTEDEADNAKKDGISIVVIGVTADVDMDELRGIASDDDLVELIDDFDALEGAVDDIIDIICDTIVLPPGEYFASLCLSFIYCKVVSVWRLQLRSTVFLVIYSLKFVDLS